MNALNGAQTPVHRIVSKDSKLRQAVEVGVTATLFLLMLDRATGHTGPAHWVHLRVRRLLHATGLIKRPVRPGIAEVINQFHEPAGSDGPAPQFVGNSRRG